MYTYTHTPFSLLICILMFQYYGTTPASIIFTEIENCSLATSHSNPHCGFEFTIGKIHTIESSEAI